MSQETKTIDQKIKEVEAIVEQLETANLPIEESLKRYKEGQKLIKELTEDFNKAKEEIQNTTN